LSLIFSFKAMLLCVFQHEILSIRAVVTDMEEKVQYQSEERLLDIREHLQSLETKVICILRLTSLWSNKEK